MLDPDQSKILEQYKKAKVIFVLRINWLFSNNWIFLFTLAIALNVTAVLAHIAENGILPTIGK